MTQLSASNMDDVFSQVWGEFKSASKATRARDKLREKGVPTEATEILVGQEGDKTYVTVRVSNKEKEEEVIEWLEDLGANPVWPETAQSMGIF